MLAFSGRFSRSCLEGISLNLMYVFIFSWSIGSAPKKKRQYPMLYQNWNRTPSLLNYQCLIGRSGGRYPGFLIEWIFHRIESSQINIFELLNWIIFLIESAEFLLNLIMFWIESLVKQCWMEHWIFFLAKFKHWIESDWVSATTIIGRTPQLFYILM